MGTARTVGRMGHVGRTGTTEILYPVFSKEHSGESTAFLLPRDQSQEEEAGTGRLKIAQPGLGVGHFQEGRKGKAMYSWTEDGQAAPSCTLRTLWRVHQLAVSFSGALLQGTEGPPASGRKGTAKKSLKVGLSESATT